MRSCEWAKIQALSVTTKSAITCGNNLMAGRGKTTKIVSDINQPGISDYIQQKGNKRGPSSPGEDPRPSKKMNSSSSQEAQGPKTEDLQNLPPELKLLYDCLSARLDSLDKRLEQNVPECVETLELAQTKTDGRISRIEKENSDLKKRLVNIEDKMLETSVVISGINEEKWEESEPRRLKLNKELANALPGETYDEKLKKASELQIISTERLGQYNPLKGRPISVKFNLKEDADRILESKKKLTKGVYAVQRYSAATDTERKRLRPILMAARKLEEYRGKCKLEGTTLTIKGKPYTWSNLNELPQNLSPQVVSSRQDANHYGFFSELNPLSNFHPAPFHHDGKDYIISEQFIQAKKAEFSGDKSSLNQIMCAKTALECKHIGNEVTNCNTEQWNAAVKELCFPGLLSKFQQNKGLGAFLKSTYNKTILECCYDKVWGNGYPLSNPQCIDPTIYKSQGILGEMLEEIRSILMSSQDRINLAETMPPMFTLPVQTSSHVETD